MAQVATRAERRGESGGLPGLGAASDECEPSRWNTLPGGDDVFGPNFGGATVYTNTTRRLCRRMLPECRRAASPTSNSALPMENEIMARNPGRRRRSGRRGQSLARGQRGCGLGLARWRDHQGWRRCRRGGLRSAGRVIASGGAAWPCPSPRQCTHPVHRGMNSPSEDRTAGHGMARRQQDSHWQMGARGRGMADRQYGLVF